jgi:hypothetical protein
MKEKLKCYKCIDEIENGGIYIDCGNHKEEISCQEKFNKQTNMKKSQLKRVEDRLKQCGEISRNECLNLPFKKKITRLGAIMNSLKNKGMEWEGFSRGNDYVYKLKVVDRTFDRVQLDLQELKEQQLKLKYA